MSRNSTLIVHSGGTRRTRDELAALHTPAGTPTWKPVPHANLVAELIRGLEAQGVTIARDDYCTMGRDDARWWAAQNDSWDAEDEPPDSWWDQLASESEAQDRIERGLLF